MIWWLLGAGVSVATVLAALEHRRLKREARRDLLTFVELFPGRCPICSYHRWGYGNALTREPRPAPHKCPEEWSRCE